MTSRIFGWGFVFLPNIILARLAMWRAHRISQHALVLMRDEGDPRAEEFTALVADMAKMRANLAAAPIWPGWRWFRWGAA